MEKPRIKLTYCGSDSWGRAVFRSERGYYYKTADVLDPDGGFPNADEKTREMILRDLYNSEPSDDFDGEPGWPVGRENFEITGA